MKWNLILNKRWYCRSCTELPFSESLVHDLIAQFVRATKRNWVVVVISHSGQLSIATSKNCLVMNIISVSSFRYIQVTTTRKIWLNELGDWRRQRPKWNLTLKKNMRLQKLYKVSSNWDFNCQIQINSFYQIKKNNTSIKI